MDCNVSCFDRILNLVSELPDENKDKALELVDKIVETPDTKARALVEEYLGLITYTDGENASRNLSLLSGMVLYDSVREGAKQIIDYSVFAKILKHSGFADEEIDDITDRALAQAEKKELDFVYTPFDVVIATIKPVEEEDDLEKAVALIHDDYSLTDFLDFVIEKNPQLENFPDKTGFNPSDVLYEGIVMWENYLDNYFEEDFDRYQELQEKIGVTEEIYDEIAQKLEEEEEYD